MQWRSAILGEQDVLTLLHRSSVSCRPRACGDPVKIRACAHFFKKMYFLILKARKTCRSMIGLDPRMREDDTAGRSFCIRRELLT